MPVYDYICINLEGEWIRAEREAADRPDLIRRLWEDRLFMVWADEKGMGDPSELLKSGITNDANLLATLHRLVVRDPTQPPSTLWQPGHPDRRDGTDRRAPKHPAPAAPTQVLFYGGVLGWVMRHSFGAVNNARQALLILVVGCGFLSSSVYLMVFGFTKATPTRELPVFEQPAPSLQIVKGKARRVRTYTFQKTKAIHVKKAMDFEMRNTSISTQLAADSNAVVVTATDNDFRLINVFMPEIDIDWRPGTDDQIFFNALNTIKRARARELTMANP